MTGPPRRGVPWRPLDVLSAMWSASTAAPVNWLVQGRRLTVKVNDTNVRLTITEFDPRLDILRLSIGRLSEVELAACNIEWAGNRIERASAVLHNVYVRPSARPELVAAPVRLTADVSAGELHDLFGRVAPRLSGGVGSDGIARLWLARRAGWGHLEVDARLADSTLWLHPRAVARGRLRWPLPARVPGYRVELPELPHGLRLTGIDFAPDRVRLSGTLPEWRVPVSSLPPI